MDRLWRTCYTLLVLPALWVLLHIMALFHRKVRRGIRGRRGLFDALRRQAERIGPGPRVWFHSSSLGEFEQAKPIIAALKRRNRTLKVIATFFSPSGFEHSRGYKLADVISYIPFDTRSNARSFLDIVRPDAAVIVRYDVWPNHIWELRRRGIPVLLANATMRRTTRRRLPLARAFHRSVYNAIDRILTVSQGDADVFATFAVRRPEIQPIGDTRFDQVSIRSEEAKRKHILAPGIVRGRKIVVAGSTWPEDEAVLLPALTELQREFPPLLLIIAPHEPTVEHLEELEAALGQEMSSIRFSSLNDYQGERVIIVDSIGILLTLYGYAQIAFVGGSFRQGVHNVLEAAVYGVPVLFGPRHRNSQEPLMLVERGGGFVVSNTADLTRTLRNLLEDDTARATAGERAALFVRSHIGATEQILRCLEPYLPASNHKEPERP